MKNRIIIIVFSVLFFFNASAINYINPFGSKDKMIRHHSTLDSGNRFEKNKEKKIQKKGSYYKYCIVDNNFSHREFLYGQSNISNNIDSILNQNHTSNQAARKD